MVEPRSSPSKGPVQTMRLAITELGETLARGLDLLIGEQTHELGFRTRTSTVRSRRPRS